VLWAGLGVSWLGRGRGLPMMGVPTPSIWKTSTWPILSLIALIWACSRAWMTWA